MDESRLPNICRACMTDKGNFQSIFVSDEKTGSAIHLGEMIMSYASVQITLGDGLPEKICVSCARKVTDFYLFKLKCEQSDMTLRTNLGKSPLVKPYSLVEEQQQYNSVFDLDNESVDVIIKPEICSLEYEATSPLMEKCSIEEESRSSERCNDNNEYADNLCIRSDNSEKCENWKKDIQDKDILDVKIISEGINVEDFNEDKPWCDEEDYKIHLADHNKEDSKQKFSCEICKRKFTKNSHVTRHMKIHASVKPYTCDKCNKSYARADQLTHHMNIHSGIKPHVCKICSKGFNQISNLKDHMRTHNGEKPFLCSTCGKGFNQLGNLRQHTVRHSGIKAHLCSICGNGFASKGELCAHLRKHTGARPFVCSVCNHGFTTSSSLTKHKRIHSGEKPYECEVCKMKFSRSGILARHKRTHTGEKPYVCKFCTKAFSQSNDLSSHLRIHTGEKPFICDVCGQAFRQSSALKTHKKTHIDKNTILDSRVVIGMVHSTFLNTL